MATATQPAPEKAATETQRKRAEQDPRRAALDAVVQAEKRLQAAREEKEEAVRVAEENVNQALRDLAEKNRALTELVMAVAPKRRGRKPGSTKKEAH